MNIYAQIDENNICMGISCLKEAVSDPSMILIEAYDINLLGKQYKEGEFIFVASEAPVEILNSEQVIMLAIADLYQEMHLLREGK